MIENIEVKNNEITGTMTVKIPFRIKPKKIGTRILGFGGHNAYYNEREEVAEAWPQNHGFRVYLNKKDNVVINYDSDSALGLEQLSELEKVIEIYGEQIQPKEKA